MLVWDDDPRSALVAPVAVEPPRAAVILLQGGRSEGTDAVPRLSLAGARMRPFARAVERACEGRGLLVGSVRYRCRGWNGDREDPLRDTLRALDELAVRAGDVPTVLVGHSMGGRAALRAGGHRLVQGVVGLAPWCPDGEPVTQLRGRRVVLLHGDRDRTTDPAASVDYADRACAAGAEACTLLMPGGDHAMLRQAGSWHRQTGRIVSGLLGFAPLPTDIADRLTLNGRTP
ncbi:alpha/beta fold hydrolase [Streptomyces sp. AcE210]|uniref:alpha/beta hydrolase n=1 Tax=Streptomyces sp. AcE210 TaxID=2292703 RepID=UPI001F0BCCEE|nr:alpha/beta fold hydrolase [Streptomyces sp. AcE210]